MRTLPPRRPIRAVPLPKSMERIRYLPDADFTITLHRGDEDARR